MAMASATQLMRVYVHHAKMNTPAGKSTAANMGMYRRASGPRVATFFAYSRSWIRFVASPSSAPILEHSHRNVNQGEKAGPEGTHVMVMKTDPTWPELKWCRVSKTGPIDLRAERSKGQLGARSKRSHDRGSR